VVQDGVATDHAIVVVDTDGHITWWSPGAEALFGHSAADALGQSLDLIVPGALRGVTCSRQMRRAIRK
jgi:PAS domain S-box-containing protein